MAYDPKSFLDQALKTGFQSVYSQPASAETGEAPQYQGDVATFGNVQVRPLMELVGQSEQDIGTSVPTGHMVSVPLTGEYEGYFRNDIYDNDGNFVKTTVSEPDTDKYGLKGLAQLGLTAASLGGFGPVASTLAKGIGAIQSKNPLALLSAATGLPGVDKILPTMPSAVSDVLKYAGQAKDVSQALKGDPSAIFRTIVGAGKAGVLPKGVTGDIDLSGNDAIPGFFDPGGEGYVDPNAGNLPDWALDPYKDTTATSFTPGSDDVYEDIESLLARYENQGFTDQPSGATDQTLEITGRRDDLNIDPWLQPFVDPERRVSVSEDQPAQIEITGKREGTIIPDWDILPDAITAPRSIRDVGNVTKVSPDEKLEGTEIKEPDLVTGLTPAKVDTTKTDTKTTTKTDTKTDTKPATPGSGMDLSALFALLGAMGGQGQDRQTPAQVNVARGTPESPYGLMYDLRG
jgi:hypothetical protein